MGRKLLVGMALIGILALAPGLAGAQEKMEHKRLHAALFELREARREVNDAKHDFGGHREKALLAIDGAIDSIKKLLRIKGDDVRGLDRSREFYKGFKDNPRLRQALIDLREARKELSEAKGDFGGLKKRAFRDIDFAIDQIQVLLNNARA
jgi:hypothetical protein